jgi:hypothetical protein
MPIGAQGEILQFAVVRAIPGLIEVEPACELAAEHALGAIKICHHGDSPAIQRLTSASKTSKTGFGGFGGAGAW